MITTSGLPYSILALLTKAKQPNTSQGRNQGFFLGQAKPMGGHNLPPLIDIGLMYLKI